jgi:2-iminoacetate synthase ThiH
VRCPYCSFEAQDAVEERAHMQAEHPEVIERRMEEAGFRRDLHTGEWVDTLGDPDA